MTPRLRIVVHQGKVYLANETDRDLKRLVYATFAWSTSDDDAVVSSEPRFEVLDLPARSFTQIEEVDPYEEGRVMYSAKRIVWAEGGAPQALEIDLHRNKVWGGASIPGSEVKCEVRLLSRDATSGSTSDD